MNDHELPALYGDLYPGEPGATVEEAWRRFPRAMVMLDLHAPSWWTEGERQRIIIDEDVNVDDGPPRKSEFSWGPPATQSQTGSLLAVLRVVAGQHRMRWDRRVGAWLYGSSKSFRRRGSSRRLPRHYYGEHPLGVLDYAARGFPGSFAYDHAAKAGDPEHLAAEHVAAVREGLAKLPEHHRAEIANYRAERAAEADAVWIRAGVVSAEEVAASRFGTYATDAAAGEFVEVQLDRGAPDTPGV